MIQIAGPKNIQHNDHDDYDHDQHPHDHDNHDHDQVTESHLANYHCDYYCDDHQYHWLVAMIRMALKFTVRAKTAATMIPMENQ